MKRASGHASRRRSTMKTLLGVLSAMIDLPLAASSRCSRRSHSRYSAALVVEPELLHRALRPLLVEVHGDVAQVQLVRRADLRVAVEQHAQQRRARAQRADHEHRRLDAGGRRRAAAACAGSRRARALQLVARRARQRAVQRLLPGHAR